MPVRQNSFLLCVALVSMILYIVLHYVTNSIGNAVKDPYMDEVFHIPQAQRYCKGNFTYLDPKITTPPGLYIVSYLRIWFRDKILFGRDELTCEVADLRRTNHLMTVLSFITVALILVTLGNKVDLSRKYGFKQRMAHTISQSSTSDLTLMILTALSVITLPPLFFFNSLYYTDAGSLLFILLAYLFSINDQHLLSATLGLIAVLFRQTNIVWLFYIAGLVALKTIDEHKPQAATPGREDERLARSYYDFLLNRTMILSLVIRCTPYALMGITFLVCAIMSNGLALGDNEAHQATFHLAQVLYFLGFCAFFGSTWILQVQIIRRFVDFTLNTPVWAVFACAVVTFTISFGSYAHPYLLKDNRHLTFYIWQKMLDKDASQVPYLMVPMYMMASIGIWLRLKEKGTKRMLLYIFCAVLSLVPNGLLEFRYFTIPFIFLRLDIELDLPEVLVELMKSQFVNIAMHYLFLNQTFYWVGSNDVQRIIW